MSLLKPQLRPATEEENTKHSEALKELLRDKLLLEMGQKEGLITESQAKLGLAENFNARNNYMAENKVWIMQNKIFIWELVYENKFQ